MTSPAARPAVLPPAPTASDLADPAYRYLGCPDNHCCGTADQAAIAAWVQGGLRPEWHHLVARWAAEGHTVADVMAYAPADPNDTLRANIVLPVLADFLRHRVAPADVHTYLQLGAVFSGHHILDLTHARAHAATVVAYLAPYVTEQNRAAIGMSFAADYALWVQLVDGRRDLITAVLAAHWHWVNVADGLIAWADTDPAIPADQIVRLHRAGISPGELARHPHLAVAADADLAALAALRN